jgi:benzoate membrane transport protein
VFKHMESPAVARRSWRQILSDFGSTYAANGLIGFIFAATGPVAVILSVGTGGGLSPEELASWVFGVFFVNGLVTLFMSWRYTTPLAFGWTIPGTVLVGPALQHLSFAEVIGAFYMTSALVLVLGLTGWVKRVMAALPMPIVMGMVAGVFLRFGLDIVRALHSHVAIAAPMVAVFLLLSAKADWGKRLPPVIGALLVGALAVALTGSLDAASVGQLTLAQPVIQAPVVVGGHAGVGGALGHHGAGGAKRAGRGGAQKRRTRAASQRDCRRLWCGRCDQCGVRCCLHVLDRTDQWSAHLLG